MKFNPGDLVYIPQGVILQEDRECPSAILKIEKPQVGVFISEDDNRKWAEIMLGGQRWTAPTTKIYRMGEENAG
tara:strand:- start:1795 stop:2016 length:222 start_codon:yes stop_codon:yes gene_type:complete